ncbi:cell division protein FtsQ/DivIB [Limosilactobacillus sp.]|jgi:cell division protein FtsQ|uniref:cell division protein FtsQ/DivIB n=1 Tax=Limosilactobacillus sp. TaxID=2773925 RepID=UPI0025BF531F|nr:FtsQ-type POTRA domain-containing protein [Limosilactobacillus sp.]MCH3922502.1 FtsQ-type POTRA domain-containing protein [Limosilactobacillus sp.]MCH3927184.1 FtsQ-type POTRA domain-containing protein [Limosilactobacillus sp.]
MARDRYVSEHQQYAQRLADLEKRSAQARQKAQKSAADRSQHISHRLPKLRWHHYKTNGERVLKLVAFFGLVLLLMIYIISPLSKVKTVTVTGNKQLPVSQVERATSVHPGRFIWGVWLHQRSICRTARFKQPRIASIRIRVTGPQSVRLTIKENALLGTTTLGKQRYAVLANGHLQASANPAGGISYQGFNKHRALLKEVARQTGKLKPAVRDGISTVTYSPTKQMPNRVVLYMRDGNTVLANAHTVGKKMAYYPAIVANMKNSGVIDLQVGAYSYDYGSQDK